MRQTVQPFFGGGGTSRYFQRKAVLSTLLLVAGGWQHRLDIAQRTGRVYLLGEGVQLGRLARCCNNHNVRGMIPPLVGMFTRQAGRTVPKVVISICVLMLCCAATGWIIF